MADGLNQTYAQTAFASTASLDPNMYGDLLPFADQVARPQYSLWDYLNGGYQAKSQKYWQDLSDRKANFDALQSARAYESSEVQRRVADMKAAGLNPYWMSNSSSAQGATSASESRNTYKASGSSAKTSNDFFSLIKTLAVMAMVAAG